MEVIWSLMLTVCMDSQTCFEQSVQWFDDKNTCAEMQVIHENIPMDGSWKSVKYECQVVGAEKA